MDAKPSGDYTEFSWTVFLDSLCKVQSEKSPEQVEQELWELYPMQTERIQ